MERQFERTHPWITFRLDGRDLDHMAWMLLGEAISKCEHVAGVPLQPSVARDLNQIYLTKGVHATTQIEGNTLSEEQVRKRVEHELSLPPSQEYLGKEIDNILEACNTVVDDVLEQRPLTITPQRVKYFNRIVLKDLPLIDEDIVPGETRKDSVLVGGGIYRGAPAEDCEYLLERLCEWLEELRSEAPVGSEQSIAILSAILAHLYVAWIHPFGDGNGRTARLIEFQLLVQAGVPTVSAHLLSDFYNRTRAKYYRELSRTSRPPYRVGEFIRYALEGLVDELREQIESIRAQQLLVTWENYIHEQFHEENTPTSIRRRHLALDLPIGKITARGDIPRLSTRLAAEFAGKTLKTITRDTNDLLDKGLIVRSRNGVRPYIEQMNAFLPPRAGSTTNT